MGVALRWPQGSSETSPSSSSLELQEPAAEQTELQKGQRPQDGTRHPCLPSSSSAKLERSCTPAREGAGTVPATSLQESSTQGDGVPARGFGVWEVARGSQHPEPAWALHPSPETAVKSPKHRPRQHLDTPAGSSQQSHPPLGGDSDTPSRHDAGWCGFDLWGSVPPGLASCPACHVRRQPAEEPPGCRAQVLTLATLLQGRTWSPTARHHQGTKGPRPQALPPRCRR